MYEIYDSARLRMGRDEAYMGSFPTIEDIGDFLSRFAILFEGYPIIQRREDGDLFIKARQDD